MVIGIQGKKDSRACLAGASENRNMGTGSKTEATQGSSKGKRAEVLFSKLRVMVPHGRISAVVQTAIMWKGWGGQGTRLICPGLKSA